MTNEEYEDFLHDFANSTDVYSAIGKRMATEIFQLREQLAIAVEALENIGAWECTECLKDDTAKEALNKIRGG